MLRLPLILALFAALSAGGAPRTEAPITGTFIQLQNWMLQLDEADWGAELTAAKRIGIDTVIIQWMKYDQTRFYPVNVAGNDPGEAILAFADRNRMKVFMGLDFQSAWWKEFEDADFLARIGRRNVAFAAKLWERYRKHPSFAGWYIPYELADVDFDDDDLNAIARFFRDVARACRLASGARLPVAMSVFFSEKLPVAGFERIYDKFLKRAGVDIAIVQDGVGVNNWEGAAEAKAAPYIESLVRSARRARVKPWAAIEVFKTVKDNRGKTSQRVPADPEQLRDQINAVVPLVDKSVMFDFFHYMSPERGSVHQSLYDWYHRKGFLEE